MNFPEPKQESLLSKYSLIGGGAVIALVIIQVLLLRVAGDLVTSLLIFGIGVFVGRKTVK